MQLELLYRGKPMPSPRAFLRKCCAGDQRMSFMSSPVDGVLRPGQTASFIRLPKRADNEAIWEKLEQGALGGCGPQLFLLHLRRLLGL